jgi:hypothetical protein
VRDYFSSLLTLVLSSIIPIHLNELAPPAFRALIPGIAYQLGAMASSPCTEMVNTIAEANHVEYRGKQVESYSQVIIVVVAICASLLVLCCAFGPERRGSHFELAKAAGTMNAISTETISAWADGVQKESSQASSSTNEKREGSENNEDLWKYAR